MKIATYGSGKRECVLSVPNTNSKGMGSNGKRLRHLDLEALMAMSSVEEEGREVRWRWSWWRPLLWCKGFLNWGPKWGLEVPWGEGSEWGCSVVNWKLARKLADCKEEREIMCSFATSDLGYNNWSMCDFCIQM
ncbi:alpha-2-macroglobulin family protein [Sesbania bispinosa]|nr:alpha-2-macroglobulin family protein [Sesbania bispinosa]KAJ1427236.1 alpha-2-macroglobulin family protein [Sesbania bispinosa]